MKTIVSLIRVSTKSQGKRGIGIEEQRAANNKFAELRGYPKVQEFVEIGTGRVEHVAQRPKLEEALTFAEQNRCPLLVDRLDRLGRNQRLVMEVGKRVTVMTAEAAGPIDEIKTQIQSAKSEKVGAMLSQRSREGLRRYRAEGNKCGSPDPAAGGRARGKQRKTAADDFAMEVGRHLAAIESRARGKLTLRQLAEALDARGIPGPSGGKWSAMAVSRVKG